MDIFVGDLDEAGAGFVEEFLGGEEAVAEVGEVGVDTEFPGVAEGFDLLGFAGEVVVFAVGDVAVVEFDLPIGAVFDAVGRIDVDALDLSGLWWVVGGWRLAVCGERWSLEVLEGGREMKTKREI